MIVLLVLGIVVLALVLLSLIRVGVWVEYAQKTFTLRLLAGPVKITLFPRKEKQPKKPRRVKKKKKKQEKKKKEESGRGKKGGGEGGRGGGPPPHKRPAGGGRGATGPPPSPRKPHRVDYRFQNQENGEGGAGFRPGSAASDTGQSCFPRRSGYGRGPA